MFRTAFPNEVMSIYNRATVYLNTVAMRNLDGAKEARFPYVGRYLQVGMHAPGAEIQGKTIRVNDLLVQVDQKMFGAIFLDDISELVSHYDYRAPFVREMATRLAETTDYMLASAIINAARRNAAASPISEQPGGTVITRANINSDADVLRAALFDAGVALDEKNIPAEGRICTLRPAQYALLVQDTDAINTDWAAGNGNLADGTVRRINNISIRKSNVIPNLNIDDMGKIPGFANSDGSAQSGVEAAHTTTNQAIYKGDFRPTVGTVHTSEAVAMARLMGLNTQIEDSVRHQGTLIVTRQAFGTGIYRPECAVELRTP